jgi:hypothetical protein
MAKISHTKIKQPSFGEKRPKLTYTKISRFTVYDLLRSAFDEDKQLHSQNCLSWGKSVEQLKLYLI